MMGGPGGSIVILFLMLTTAISSIAHLKKCYVILGRASVSLYISLVMKLLFACTIALLRVRS